MTERLVDEARLKETLKEAVAEALSERRELFYELMAEVIEDFALGNAIEEGKDSASVSEDEVLKAL